MQYFATSNLIGAARIPAAVTRTCLFSPDPSSPRSLARALEGSGNETRNGKGSRTV